MFCEKILNIASEAEVALAPIYKKIDEIPFDEMPHDEDIPPIDVTAISDEDPIDLPDMEDDVFSSLDPFADRRKQYPPEEEQDYVEIEGDMIPEDIDNVIQLIKNSESTKKGKQLLFEAFAFYNSRLSTLLAEILIMFILTTLLSINDLSIPYNKYIFSILSLFFY